MNKIFSINFKVLALLLIKRKWQQPKRMAGIYAVLKPVMSVYNAFITFYNDCLYYLAHTSQVVFIESALNDMFDPGLRRIRIVDASIVTPLYVYKTPEAKPVYLRKTSEASPTYLRKESECFPNGIHFIVEVPVTLVYDQSAMIALVKRYCLPGRLFIIQQV